MRDKKTKSKDEDNKAMHEKIEALQEELESVQTERDELLGKLQRVSADYANFEKRMTKQVRNTVAYEKKTIIKTLLPTLHDLERTLREPHATESTEAVLKGVRIIYDEMVKALATHGVEQIHALGETFDPIRHEAIDCWENPDEPDQVVLEESEKGYQLNGQVILPSKVVVTRRPAARPPEQENEPPVEGGTPSIRGYDAPDTSAPEQATDETEASSERDTETE